MAATASLRSLRSTLSRRLFITATTHRLTTPTSFTRSFRSTVSMSHWMRATLNSGSNYSEQSPTKMAPVNSGSNYSEQPPTEMSPVFPGCDYDHWLVVMDEPCEDATKEQMIDCYVKTLATVLGSEEEAKKKIYSVSCQRYFAFGCAIDIETSNKLEGAPGVVFVVPDSYVDAENKDFGAELYVNGDIVERSPERQRRVEPVPRRAEYIPRYTLYVKRRETAGKRDACLPKYAMNRF